MMILRGNSLKGDSTNLCKREIRKLIEEIPEERRAVVLDQIRARRFFSGDGDNELSRLAIKYLKGV